VQWTPGAVHHGWFAHRERCRTQARRRKEISHDPKVFIDRPIFAWVIAIIIVLGGVLALRQLPVASYPAVAPPALAISVTTLVLRPKWWRKPRSR